MRGDGEESVTTALSESEEVLLDLWIKEVGRRVRSHAP
jgi:hypothetical protein